MKNIIVTGCNKGIGFGIVQILASKEKWNIIMACRNTEAAQKARKEVLEQYPKANLHIQELDISKDESIDKFIPEFQKKYTNIDVLLNNAGVATKTDDPIDMKAYDYTFNTNFFGTIRFTEKALPLLKDNGKVIFLGSMAGPMFYNRIKKDQFKKRIKKQDITKEEIFALVEQFKNSLANNSLEKDGWPQFIYGLSKLGINTYARVLGADKDVLKRNIQVYSCCPGYVNTDMSSGKGPLTIAQGAETPIHLTQLPFEVDPKIQGGFFQKCKLSSTYE